jgi:hypothetical protein
MAGSRTSLLVLLHPVVLLRLVMLSQSPKAMVMASGKNDMSKDVACHLADSSHRVRTTGISSEPTTYSGPALARHMAAGSMTNLSKRRQPRANSHKRQTP